MDIVIKRFPFVSYKVLKNLDDKSLVKSKEINRQIAKFVENKRLYLIRIIKLYKWNFEGFEESWKEVINRIPINVMKQLASKTQKLFESDSVQKELKVAPLHIAVEKGTLELFSLS